LGTNPFSPLPARAAVDRLEREDARALNAADVAADLLQRYGYTAVFVLPMLESVGLPVPGETMLLAAAVYAATTGRLSIAGVVLAAAAGSVLGGNLGYLVGRRGGRGLALRYGRFFLVRERQLRLGERFFARHGSRAVFVARFVAVLRTVTSFLAGVSRMHLPSFLAFNAAGGVAWALFYGLGAYALGRQFSRYQALFTGLGLGLAAVAIVGIGLGLFFGRDRFERWALGSEDD
jgi:membrane protein DedA with SNARE-associated domain